MWTSCFRSRSILRKTLRKRTQTKRTRRRIDLLRKHEVHTPQLTESPQEQAKKYHLVYNLCSTHQIKLPNAMKLQSLFKQVIQFCTSYLSSFILTANFFDKEFITNTSVICPKLFYFIPFNSSRLSWNW